MKADVSEVKYLIDSPIDGSSGDALEHKSLAQTLGDIITKWEFEKGPFTIGLFGSWGTGKSGIGRVLRSEFIDQDTTAIVEFDIWKYESDSFRRQFLLFLNEKEGFDTALPTLKKIYESSTHIEQTTSLSPDKNALSRILVPTAVALAGAGMFFASGYVSEPSAWRWILQVLGSLGTLTGFSLLFAVEFFKKILDWLFSSVQGLLKIQEVTITEHRIEFAEQFERLFDEIVSAKLGQGYEKVVIIIDNLDRVSDEKILQLLSSVKTFLEHKKVAFLIQCDESAIKRHLLHIYHKESNNEKSERLGERYTDEFLRKFFNTYVRIPPLLAGDLDNYAGSLIAETKLPIADEQTRTDLLSVISSAHRDSPNPRKIKQFINALVSAYLLAYHREGEGTILQPEGVVTSNIQMLAKAMLIEQNFPEIYEELKKEPGLWNVLDKAIVSSQEPKDRRLQECLKERGDDSLHRFLVRTKFITTNNISPFIFLKQSNDSRKISTNADLLTQALQDADDDKISELLTQTKTESVLDLQKFIEETIDNVKSSSVRVFNIINSFFSNKDIKRFNFTQSFYSQLASYILGSTTGFAHHIEGFRLPVVFDFILPGTDDSSREQLAERYVELFRLVAAGEKLRVNLEEEKYINQLFKYIAASPDRFTLKQQRAISKILNESSILNTLPKAEIFFGDKNSLNAFIQSAHVEKIINTLSNGDLDASDDEQSQLTRKVRIILKAESKINGSSANSLILKLTELAAQPQSIGDEAMARIINRAIREVLETLKGRVSLDQVKNLGRRLRGNYDQNSHQSSRVFITINMLLLRGIAVNDHGSDVDPLKQYTHDALNSLPLAAIKDVFGSLKVLNETGAVYDAYREVLNHRALSQEDMFRYLEKEYETQYKEALLARIIKDSGQVANAIELLKQWRSVKDKELMANCVLSRAQRENFPLKIKIMEVLPKVGYKQTDFKNIVIRRLFEMLQNQQVDFQKQTTTLVLQFRESGYLTNAELEQLGELFIEDAYGRNITNAPSVEGAFNLISMLPLSENGHRKLSEILIRRMALHSLNDNRAMGLILNWAKEASVTYAHNTESYEALYNTLRNQGQNVQKTIAEMVIDFGLVDKRSKDFYQRIEHLTGRA